MDFNQNYFEIFGLPVNYQVDTRLLADRFLEMQKELHPDNFAAGTDEEKRLSMQWATFLNTANDTLKGALPRAIYMLELSGVEIEENPELSPMFLMEQIELRESLEEIEDADDPLAELDRFKAQVTSVMQDIESRFDAAVSHDLKAAEQAVYELQFMSKLAQSANQLEEKLLDY